MTIFVWGSLAAKNKNNTDETAELLGLFHIRHLPSTNTFFFPRVKIWIWWFSSLTPKISRQMPDKCPDIYQSTISVSCFFPIHAAATIHHRGWSLPSECLLNVTRIFSQAAGGSCAQACEACDLLVFDWGKCPDVCRELCCDLCACRSMCVHVGAQALSREG